MASPRKTAGSTSGAKADLGLRILKKYPNRRLYDTRTSSYITLADVKRMVMTGEEFEVRDAKSAEDLTRSILLQIILEEESGGVPMFTTPMLSQLIRFYGHAMQGMMGAYLEKNLHTFVELQQRFVGDAKALQDPTRLSADAWAQLMNTQAPMVQALMKSYTEQTAKLIEQMQAAGGLFPGMPGFPPGKR